MNFVLGAEAFPAQRMRTANSLLAMVVFALFAGVQQFEVREGYIDQTASNILSAYDMAGALVFFALIRSGLNLRIAADCSLTFAQCLFGISSVSASYAITGPARGSIMAILLLILVFAMFALKRFQIRLLSLFALAGLGSAMVVGHVTQPDRYPASIEVTHAMVALIIVSFISILSVRLRSLRDLLQRQKADLKHALEENRRLAALDELTGLFNRRHMGMTLLAEHERQRRDPGRMSIALIDIDFFKTINDRYGHAAGDAVLREFAQLAKRALRACDSAARWGGEEFLIAMPGASSDEAVAAIERLRTAFATLQFPAIDQHLRVTLSAGVATCLTPESVDSLIERADRCMYNAKASGRDRVCTNASPGHPGDPPGQAPLEFAAIAG